MLTTHCSYGYYIPLLWLLHTVAIVFTHCCYGYRLCQHHLPHPGDVYRLPPPPAAPNFQSPPPGLRHPYLRVLHRRLPVSGWACLVLEPGAQLRLPITQTGSAAQTGSETVAEGELRPATSWCSRIYLIQETQENLEKDFQLFSLNPPCILQRKSHLFMRFSPRVDILYI